MKRLQPPSWLWPCVFYAQRLLSWALGHGGLHTPFAKHTRPAPMPLKRMMRSALSTHLKRLLRKLKSGRV